MELLKSTCNDDDDEILEVYETDKISFLLPASSPIENTEFEIYIVSLNQTTHL